MHLTLHYPDTMTTLLHRYNTFKISSTVTETHNCQLLKLQCKLLFITPLQTDNYSAFSIEYRYNCETQRFQSATSNNQDIDHKHQSGLLEVSDQPTIQLTVGSYQFMSFTYKAYKFHIIFYNIHILINFNFHNILHINKCTQCLKLASSNQHCSVLYTLCSGSHI